MLPGALKETAEREDPLRYPTEHELLGAELAASVMRYREAHWRAEEEPEYKSSYG